LPAPNGARALEEIRSASALGNGIPLVLLDGILPGEDGFAVAEQIQAAPKTKPQIILMLSAADRQKFAEQCSKLNIAAFLEKPVSRSALRKAIVRALQAETPAADAPPLMAGESRETELALRTRLRILLVEDTPANQKLILRILERRGHLIEIAPNGHEALAWMGQQSFDVVLMDVQMPVMDGFQATAAIRALGDARRAQIPIIAMTAHAMQGDRERCLAAGMDGYIAKPIHSEMLIELVESLGRREPTGGVPL
jgi:CheY-like chemotaxis protein